MAEVEDLVLLRHPILLPDWRRYRRSSSSEPSFIQEFFLRSPIETLQRGASFSLYGTGRAPLRRPCSELLARGFGISFFALSFFLFLRT